MSFPMHSLTSREHNAAHNDSCLSPMRIRRLTSCSGSLSLTVRVCWSGGRTDPQMGAAGNICFHTLAMRGCHKRAHLVEQRYMARVSMCMETATCARGSFGAWRALCDKHRIIYASSRRRGLESSQSSCVGCCSKCVCCAACGLICKAELRVCVLLRMRCSAPYVATCIVVLVRAVVPLLVLRTVSRCQALSDTQTPNHEVLTHQQPVITTRTLTQAHLMRLLDASRECCHQASRQHQRDRHASRCRWHSPRQQGARGASSLKQQPLPGPSAPLIEAHRTSLLLQAARPPQGQYGERRTAARPPHSAGTSSQVLCSAPVAWPSGQPSQSQRLRRQQSLASAMSQVSQAAHRTLGKGKGSLSLWTAALCPWVIQTAAVALRTQ